MALVLPLHCTQEADYATAVEASIATGGCTVSRATLAGACFGSMGTESVIPPEWIANTTQGTHVQDLAAKLVALREAASTAAGMYCKKLAENYP
mmetsp:Transcript_60877/g.113852  ORF Transcript_60877/g.113852 Transcript_60877/m.113852 type:complete len:94 (+) Transcript_60877:836-1117(+)